MNQAPSGQPPASSNTGLIIGIIVASVLAVLAVGVYTVVGMSRTFKELAAPSDAGPQMSEEEIQALLAGPKRDFVGRWESPNGGLIIQPDGRVVYGMQVGVGRENANGRIESFHDDAFYIMKFRFQIEEPPHHDGKKWKMRVRGHYFERSN